MKPRRDLEQCEKLLHPLGRGVVVGPLSLEPHALGEEGAGPELGSEEDISHDATGWGVC